MDRRAHKRPSLTQQVMAQANLSGGSDRAMSSTGAVRGTPSDADSSPRASRFGFGKPVQKMSKTKTAVQKVAQPVQPVPPAKKPINVWGGDSPETTGDPPVPSPVLIPSVQPGQTASQGVDKRWVVAVESVKHVNGRTIRESKLVRVQEGKKREEGEAEREAKKREKREQEREKETKKREMERREKREAKTTSTPKTTKPTLHTMPPRVQPPVPPTPPRGPTPTPPTSPPYANDRACHIARWVLEMRHRAGGGDAAFGPRAALHRPGAAADDDAATEITTDLLQWPSLLRDPVVNNDSLPATEPTGALHQQRMRILINFAARCRETHGGGEGEKKERKENGWGNGKNKDKEKGIDNNTATATATATATHCPLCRHADAFTMRPQHGRLFLDSVLLPLSEAIPFADVVQHVNTSVVERLYVGGGLGESEGVDEGVDEVVLRSADARTMPIYEDYRRALVLARHRQRVFAALSVTLDGCGLVRGGRGE